MTTDEYDQPITKKQRIKQLEDALDYANEEIDALHDARTPGKITEAQLAEAHASRDFAHQQRDALQRDLNAERADHIATRQARDAAVESHRRLNEATDMYKARADRLSLDLDHEIESHAETRQLLLAASRPETKLDRDFAAETKKLIDENRLLLQQRDEALGAEHRLQDAHNKALRDIDDMIASEQRVQDAHDRLQQQLTDLTRVVEEQMTTNSKLHNQNMILTVANEQHEGLLAKADAAIKDLIAVCATALKVRT